MAKPLRVLIVEDDPAAVELLVGQLDRGGFEVAHRQASNAEQLADALQRHAWDLVLADYDVPGLGGAEALKIVQTAGTDIPFIVVSGPIGEEVAAAMIRAGAHDFILKDNPSRLAAAINRELREARERNQRRQLEKVLVEVADNEQRRIGMDLHDTLGQDLTGIAFLTKLLAEKLSAANAPEARDAVELGRRINQAIAQTRAIARGLCPIVSSEDGLTNALQEFLADVQNVFGVQCRLHCEQPMSMGDSALSTHLYQIVREAVNNAVSHGKARNIDVTIIRDADRLSLTVKDDGLGMPQKARRAGRGLGLHAMSHRAKTIGGMLSIESTGNGGTAVTCTVRG